MGKTANKVRLVAPQLTHRLEGVKIDYDLTPRRAIELLPDSNPDIALWPEDKMNLWNGGKAGIVEEATLPIFWPKKSFSTAAGRQEQETLGIGFSWPVEIASIALLKKKDLQRIREELNKLGIWYLVALRTKNEELWQRVGCFRPFCLYLNPLYFEFNLGNAGNDWDDRSALVGAPQVPH